MDYRQLGSSGLRVSTITLGTMGFGGAGNFGNVGSGDVKEARRQLELCRDHGVNLVDTADVYSDGRSEEIVGQALGADRDDWLVATKVRFPMSPGGPNDAGLSRHHVLRGCEASLRRLGTDHIDLYQLHEWDGRTPLEETLGALQTLVEQGKVRYVGVSNYSGWQLLKALGASERHGLPRFAAEQIYYSLQARDAENELLPAAVDQGLGVLVWSPLAGGLLSGKYSRGRDGTLKSPKGSRHASDWSEPPIDFPDRLFATIDVLKDVGRARKVSAAQVALAWLLTRPAVTSLIVGARDTDQLADNLAGAELVLTDDELARLEQVSRPPLPYPYWHQNATAADRFGPADLALHQPYLHDS
ncbi:Predicted oxidoreductase [Jatrophihabitans endophyticus]|uniref:Predicted oxidoreductase n=1 Tax=Jatrophihabitans endophyticus TaxID=1206085 RepID=A0A1M5BX97_9ACTN|nr:aldo/keto reductase [Jatrophihabitans endophyticus]SHF47026.1 Predicted oxidoreductase [Jatrophihabitans endophyticus]